MALHLPNYDDFIHSISQLDLPISGSELHGTMCGYHCAGDANKGETYLRALIKNKNDPDMRAALLALFSVSAVSLQQIASFNFEFQLLLPDGHEPLLTRAQAFSEWCEGFAQGIAVGGVEIENLREEEAKEAMQHLLEFSQLDYENLDIEEEDERALMEVSEYARMAVLSIYNDLHGDNKGNASLEIAH